MGLSNGSGERSRLPPPDPDARVGAGVEAARSCSSRRMHIAVMADSLRRARASARALHEYALKAEGTSLSQREGERKRAP